MIPRISLLAALITLPLCNAPAEAQAQNAPQGEQTLSSILEQIKTQAQPPLRSGLRAHLLRETQRVVPVVVLAPGAEAAAEAIASWQGPLRFPVLIDDGSLEASERIARFVRAFDPARVVRWSPDTSAWPDGDRAARFERIGQALASTLAMNPPSADPALFTQAAQQAGVDPGGVVAIDPGDDAWVAGLALAAGRIQLLVSIEAGGSPNRVMQRDRVEQIESSIRAASEDSGLEWQEIGDDIDAVTIAANMPSRVAARPGARGLASPTNDDPRALTDALARGPSDPDTRWAYAGLLLGNGEAALYRAMCGLFLPASDAWLFDGYPSQGTFAAYDLTKAAATLRDAGWQTTLYDDPKQSASEWSAALPRGIAAELIMVNTKGNAPWFELAPGRVHASDVPLLDRPAAVYFVHSWSARSPASRDTVAGRWLERGVYAYLGSVHEPFLGAFVQSPVFAQRLAAGASFAAAARQPGGPVWKLNVLGDPLVTLRADATAGQRLEADALPLSDVTDLKDELRPALREDDDFPRALRTLVMLGRDADAARLAGGLLSGRPNMFGNAAAKQAAMPLFRAERFDLLVECYRRMNLTEAEGAVLADAIWHASEIITGDSREHLAGVLRQLLRGPDKVGDAVAAARIIRSTQSAEAARSFLRSVAAQVDSDRDRQRLEEAVRAIGG